MHSEALSRPGRYVFALTFLAGALILSFAPLVEIPVVSAQSCTTQGHCACSGGSQWGGSCGNCGTQRRDCNGCNWGGWYCANQGVCSPGSTQCDSGNYETCTSSCEWTDGGGTDADGDGYDEVCGDSGYCDLEPAYIDATKLAEESGSYCTDALDNDCDGQTDADDQPDCCTPRTRSCFEYTNTTFDYIHDFYQTTSTDRSLQIIDGRYFSCPTSDADGACCADADACVFEGTCYGPGSKVDIDGDTILEVCRGVQFFQNLPDNLELSTNQSQGLGLE